MSTPLSRALQFRSGKFDHSSKLPEDDNAGNAFYGKDVAQFLAKGLTAAGMAAEFVDEDWGWLVHGKVSGDTPFDVAVYNPDQEEDGGPGTDRWGLWLRAYAQKKVLGLFSKKAEVAVPDALVAAVRQVFAGAGISLEPWPDGPGNA